MPADSPTILATSGGLKAGRRVAFEFGKLTEHAIELSGCEGTPRICFVTTAMGDDRGWVADFADACQVRGVQGSTLRLFPMPNVEDMEQHLLDQDVVWVLGGSVAGLLAMWRLHGLDLVMHTVWQAGVVLTGVSAGSLCWHIGGTTDSFGPELRPVTNGLAFLPWSNGVHYDAEPQRRPLMHQLVADGTLPDGYATDNNAGLLYRGTELVEALAENGKAGAYRVVRVGDSAEETPLDVTRL